MYVAGVKLLKAMSGSTELLFDYKHDLTKEDTVEHAVALVSDPSSDEPKQPPSEHPRPNQVIVHPRPKQVIV